MPVSIKEIFCSKSFDILGTDSKKSIGMCLLLLSTSSSPFSRKQNLNHTQSPIKSNHFFVAVVTVYMVDVVIVSVVVCVTVAVVVIVAVPFFFVFGCRCCFKMSCFCFPAPVSSLFPSRWSMLGLSIEIWKWGGVERNLFQLTLPSFYCYALPIFWKWCILSLNQSIRHWVKLVQILCD